MEPSNLQFATRVFADPALARCPRVVEAASFGIFITFEDKGVLCNRFHMNDRDVALGRGFTLEVTSPRDENI